MTFSVTLMDAAGNAVEGGAFDFTYENTDSADWESILKTYIDSTPKPNIAGLDMPTGVPFVQTQIRFVSEYETTETTKGTVFFEPWTQRLNFILGDSPLIGREALIVGKIGDAGDALDRLWEVYWRTIISPLHQQPYFVKLSS